MSIQRHTLSATSVKTFPNLVEGNQLIFETKPLTGDAIDDGKAMGEVVISTAVAGVEDVEIGRQKLIPGDRPLFLIPGGITGPFTLTGELFPWITGSYLITVWASTVDAGDGSDGGSDEPTGPQHNPVSFVSWGDDLSSLVIGGDRAVFVGDGTSPTWQVGAHGEAPISQYFEFSMGVGLSFCGLSPLPLKPLGQWGVAWWSLPYAWSIEKNRKIRSFWSPTGDPRDYGRVVKSDNFPWIPLDILRLEVTPDTISYQAKPYGENSFIELDLKSRTENGPLYPVAVLGPGAFVFNAKNY